ncbi:hypothetical protein, partial [Rhizobium leguminosarum]|uniref:hypothetical protein n=1 Tax=Rhizobium leguminosarum TaxID=384 RepID=UPI003F9BD918
ENYATKYGLPAGSDSVSLNTFGAPETKFDFVSPWKIIISGSYVINEVEDTRKQKGLITADIEYVTTQSGKFSAGDEAQGSD